MADPKASSQPKQAQEKTVEVGLLDQIVGVFTERDVMRKVALGARKPADIPVREVMTTPVVLATEHISPAEALVVMVDAHHRHLPIVDDNGKLLGILSIRHVLQAKIDELTGQLQVATKA